jgi:small conductance mechanosensitive channel
MPDVTAQTGAIVEWLEAHALGLVIWGVILFVVFRFARPLIHRLLMRAVRVSDGATGASAEGAAETAKRVATVEDLLARVLKFGVVLAGVILLFSVFDLWPVLAGLGLVAAALTLAGQSIVLDYLMGILILLEGPYFKGDVIAIGGIEGTVEEVGIRRTIIRDTSGTVHSISNGEIRIASNLTRVYASAVVDIGGIADRDIERAIEVMDRVGADLAADEAWQDRILEQPKYASTTAFTDLGVTLRMSGKVRPADRWAAAAELRRRLAVAFAEADVVPNRRPVGAPSPTDREPNL